MTPLPEASLSRRTERRSTCRRVPRATHPTLAVSLLVTSIALVACKSSVATLPECDAVAKHLADLQVEKEKRPPLGRLATAPFNTKENEDAIHAEARESARARCGKGWKRAVYDCMLDAKTIESADKCRFE